ncbi:MAG: hypothetical protein WKF44_03445, partial [Rubrobacteraceae bacterium]
APALWTYHSFRCLWLKKVPNRVGVSGGSNKALPNIGAVRAELLNVLITDEDTDTEMLAILDSENAAPKSGTRIA